MPFHFVSNHGNPLTWMLCKEDKGVQRREMRSPDISPCVHGLLCIV